MQAHNQIKGILGQILQLFGFQWSAKLRGSSRSFPCLCRRCFYQVFRVFPSLWKYCCSWNLLLLFSDWLICVTLRGRRPRYKRWGLILQGAEGSWYPAVVAGAGERVLNLVLADSLGLVGFDVARLVLMLLPLFSVGFGRCEVCFTILGSEQQTWEGWAACLAEKAKQNQTWAVLLVGD